MTFKRAYLIMATCALLSGCSASSVPPSSSVISEIAESTTPDTMIKARTIAADESSDSSEININTQVETTTITSATLPEPEQKNEYISAVSTDYAVISSDFPEISFDAEEWNKTSAYIEFHDNRPLFTENEKKTAISFENYSATDDLGRCLTAEACIGTDIMPTEERGKIGMIKPSGWKTSKYDKSIIEDMYLFNRCHLVAFCLAGENDNTSNLITGTRYMNIEGMLHYEDLVYDYMMNNPDNHVMYRVTPVYKGNDLVAQGVVMEGWSVEDKGEGVCFCGYCYNVQPNIIINYANGDNWLDPSVDAETLDSDDAEYPEEENTSYKYILNVRSHKIHYPDCKGVKDMSDKNKEYTSKTVEELEADGYSPCGMCHPH